MPKLLVIHGAGMNMRGKVQLDIFGPMLLPEYDEHIRKYAAEHGFEVEIFHSNIEGEVINKLYAAQDSGVDACIMNPAGHSAGYRALYAALAQVKFRRLRCTFRIRRGAAGNPKWPRSRAE